MSKFNQYPSTTPQSGDIGLLSRPPHTAADTYNYELAEAPSGNLVVQDETGDLVSEVVNIIFVGATVSPSSGTGTATVTVGYQPAIWFLAFAGD